ncbi:MAG: hypothetical protein H6732_13385 [Alphaproteobacteria bacterium]|nr:hypothetical protein [Alphaproteobacteria bacterium]
MRALTRSVGMGWGLLLAACAGSGTAWAHDGEHDEGGADERGDTRVLCPRPGSRLAKRLPRTESDLRRLKCHSFFAPGGVDDAFVTSTVGSTTAAALLSYPGAIATDGTPYDLLLVGASLQGRGSIQFAGWAMIYAHIAGNVVVGSNIDSALSVGAIGSGNWDVGVGVKLFRIERTGTQMSVRGKFVGDAGVHIRPGTLVEVFDTRASAGEIPREGDVATAITNSTELGGGGSLNFAQAFASFASLQASFQMTGGPTQGEEISQDANGDFVKTPVTGSYMAIEPGVALTLDGWPRFPVAFQVEYAPAWRRDTVGAASADQLDHNLLGGIFYSGSPDVVIGLRGGGVVATSLPTPVLRLVAGLELQVYL